MRYFLFIAFFLCLLSCKVKQVKSDALPVTHELWTQELQKYVDNEGWVDYTAWQKDTTGLVNYLQLLAGHHPNKSWSDEEQISYWMNAYNAFTVQMMLRNWPVESIKDIKDGVPFVNTVWDIKFIEIEGHKYDLNNLEHGILRKYFEEPRIHFAVNCASMSCAPLLNEAYEAETMDQQLEARTSHFINNKSRNRITKDKLKLSKYFTWYKGDFTNEGSVVDYIRKYSKTKFVENPDIEYLDYNWKANDIKNKPQ